jgi:hypothetical protein
MEKQIKLGGSNPPKFIDGKAHIFGKDRESKVVVAEKDNMEI